jgi:hypothetical protein
MKGFSPRLASWIQQVTSKGYVGVKVNDSVGHYFQTKKRCLARRSFITYSFQYCGRCPCYLNCRAKDNDMFRGLVPNIVDDNLSIL